MFQRNHGHVGTGDLGLVLLLIQSVKEADWQSIDLFGQLRVTKFLSIPAAPLITNDPGAEHDQRRRSGDPWGREGQEVPDGADRIGMVGDEYLKRGDGSPERESRRLV